MEKSDGSLLGKDDEAVAGLYGDLLKGFRGVSGIVSMAGETLRTEDLVGDLGKETCLRAMFVGMHRNNEADIKAWQAES
ncbi:MAG: hypothetical protein AAB953_01335 [Patescibacteria group bacterium]